MKKIIILILTFLLFCTSISFASLNTNYITGIGYIDMNLSDTAPSHSEGRLFYDNTTKAFSIYNDISDVTLQVGEELWLRVRNDAGYTIEDGSAVYITGATGQVTTIAKAKANHISTAHVLGVATHDILHGEYGYVTTEGIVNNLDTSAYSEGDVVYLSETEAGNWTTNKPNGEFYDIEIGHIAYSHVSNGKLQTHINTDSIHVPIGIYTTGNFNGSMFTRQTNSSASDSNSLFQVISDTKWTPQFQVQNGVNGQASFIVGNFIVVNQNNTLLNSSQNNLCSDRFSKIECNSADNSDVGVEGDLEIGDIIYAQNGIHIHTEPYGAYLFLDDDDTVIAEGVNGTYNVTTNFFCDFVANNFTSGMAENSWMVITDESTEYHGGVAGMKTFINSSCFELANNPSWNASFSNVIFEAYNHPDYVAADDGFFEFYIGESSRSKLKISINNGTGQYGTHITGVAGANDFTTLGLETDIGAYTGITAFGSLFESSALTHNTDTSNILLQYDATNFNNSYHAFITANIIGNRYNDSDLSLIEVTGDFDHYIRQISDDFINRSYYDNGASTTDITTSIGNGSTTNSIMETLGSILYVSAETNFTSIAFSFSTPSSKDLGLQAFYCNSSDEWQEFDDPFADNTNGMQNSGTITISSITNRGTCNFELDGTAFADTNNYTYIAFNRTAIVVPVTPIVSTITISGSGTSFMLMDDLIKITPVSTPPHTCDANMFGGFYVDVEVTLPCYCDGTNWKQMDDFSSVCS